MRIRRITLEEASGIIEPEPDTIYIFEDRWKSKRELLQKRIDAHSGVFRSIFARKCGIFKPDAAEARAFLDANHIYGYAKCKYRYGLKLNGETVAISSFSEPRPITRNIDGEDRIVQSYEWVRAASLPDCRICGGMGKMLEAFIRDVHPEDIMAYADREWSEGGVYEKLGFRRVGTTDPVRFYIDPDTFERFPLNKIGRDRMARERRIPDGARLIYNLGSVKYVRTLF